jgi:hypothetical protein
MKNDLDKLQLNLEYGQIIKFNNKYNILNSPPMKTLRNMIVVLKILRLHFQSFY